MEMLPRLTSLPAMETEDKKLGSAANLLNGSNTAMESVASFETEKWKKIINGNVEMIQNKWEQ